MQILINGKTHTLAAPANLRDLLDSIGFKDKPIVVELNREAIFPRDYAQTPLADGDQLEIITIAAGG